MATNGNREDLSIKCRKISNNEFTMDSIIQADLPDDKQTEGPSRESLTITVQIYNDVKLSIYKPMIPLKLALFFWFGAGSVIQPFLTVFFKQRGITLSELSTMYVITPIVQFFGPTLSGIIADKLGQSKPVLMANLLLSVLFAGCMLVVPSMNTSHCNNQPALLKCHRQEFNRLISKTMCDIKSEVVNFEMCNVNCPENVTQYCAGQNLICEVLDRSVTFGNFSLKVHVNNSYKVKKQCYYNVASLSHKNVTYSWCDVPHKMYCEISCTVNYQTEQCLGIQSKRTTLFVINLVIMILFTTVFSNCYRFFDVTAMELVKEHDSDFGRERFWSISGILLFSPLAGYIVEIASPKGGPEYYDAAFYLFGVVTFLTMIFVWNLKVQINPPGKRMWKKSVTLLKDSNVLSFFIVLLVIGTAWGFYKTFIYWYLKELKAPSFLLGLLPAVSSLYGLPFLITSNWWVKKIGTTNIFLLALVCYTVSCIGYSFLENPWIALVWETSNIFTYHLLWVSVVVHSHSISPEGLTATVIAAAGGLHYGVGKGTGSLIGGQIMHHYSGKVAYRVIAAICIVTAVLYVIYLYIRRCSRPKDTETPQKENEKGVLPPQFEAESILTVHEQIVKV